jgi:hypothetical protein
MSNGSRPSGSGSCMKCGKAPARYYGNWGKQGLCRACVQNLPWDLRMKVLADLRPEDQKRWQLDALIRREKETDSRRRDLPARPMSPSDTPTTDASWAAEGGFPKIHRPSRPKKRVTDSAERRKHPRVSAKLPVGFSIRPTRGDLSRFRGSVFRSVSRDISVGGIGILVHDLALLDLAAGCQLTLRISLAQPAKVIGCLGELRNAVKGTRGQESAHLCVQFGHLAPEQDRTLRRFVSARGSTRLG